VRIYEEPATRGQVLNVATGRETSINDLVHRILSAMGSNVALTFGPARPGDVRRHCGGVSRLRAMTGFEPSEMSEDALRETIEWYREHRETSG
jgi:nucleoside-diphosphate-sugar epimerase